MRRVSPPTTGFLAVNHAFELMTGLSAGDIIGRTVLEVLPGTGGPTGCETCGKVALTGEPLRFESRAEQALRSVHAFRPQEGQFVCVFRETYSNLRRRTGEIEAMAEKLPKNKANDYRTIFEGAIEGIYRTSLQGKCLPRIRPWRGCWVTIADEEVVSAITDAARGGRWSRMIVCVLCDCSPSMRSSAVMNASTSARMGPRFGSRSAAGTSCRRDGVAGHLYIEGFIQDVAGRGRGTTQDQRTNSDGRARAGALSIFQIAGRPDPGIQKEVYGYSRDGTASIRRTWSLCQLRPGPATVRTGGQRLRKKISNARLSRKDGELRWVLL